MDYKAAYEQEFKMYYAAERENIAAKLLIDSIYEDCDVSDDWLRHRIENYWERIPRTPKETLNRLIKVLDSANDMLKKGA